MLLRVRGNGSSPENSQAALVYLRGFRLTNTKPPIGTYTVDGVARPLCYPHFHVGIQIPGAGDDVALGKHLHHTAWREVWNLYDVVYDELCLFPGVDITTALLSSLSCAGGREEEEEETVAAMGFTQLAARSGARKAVVVTHYFQGDGVQRANDGVSAKVVVLDVSAVPLASAAKKIAVEVAWVAAYAFMLGALEHAACIVVRLPYLCYVNTVGRSPIVQDGLDFLGEHLTLLTQRFAICNENDSTCSVDVCFVGAGFEQLQETLVRLCPSQQAEGSLEEEEEEEEAARNGVFIFAGDHDHDQQQLEREMQCLASSVGVNVRLKFVPLKSFFEDGEEQWDAATTRENQVLNFCPCCGHCGGHEN